MKDWDGVDSEFGAEQEEEGEEYRPPTPRTPPSLLAGALADAALAKVGAALPPATRAPDKPVPIWSASAASGAAERTKVPKPPEGPLVRTEPLRYYDGIYAQHTYDYIYAKILVRGQEPRGGGSKYVYACIAPGCGASFDDRSKLDGHLWSKVGEGKHCTMLEWNGWCADPKYVEQCRIEEEQRLLSGAGKKKKKKSGGAASSASAAETRPETPPRREPPTQIVHHHYYGMDYGMGSNFGKGYYGQKAMKGGKDDGKDAGKGPLAIGYAAYAGKGDGTRNSGHPRYNIGYKNDIRVDMPNAFRLGYGQDDGKGYYGEDDGKHPGRNAYSH